MAEERASTTTTTDDLKQKLSEQIDAARGKLEELKNDVVTLHEEDMERFRRKKDEIDKRVGEQKERFRKMQADIARWKDEKVAYTQEAIASWQQRRELQKLADRAERAEDYALKLVNIAAIDFEEAEQAVLEALEARLDAELANEAAGNA